MLLYQMRLSQQTKLAPNEDIEKTVELAKAFKTGRYEVPASLQGLYGAKTMLTQEKEDQATNFPTVVKKRNTKNDSNSSDDFESEWRMVARKKKSIKPTKKESNISSTKTLPSKSITE